MFGINEEEPVRLETDEKSEAGAPDRPLVAACHRHRHQATNGSDWVGTSPQLHLSSAVHRVYRRCSRDAAVLI